MSRGLKGILALQSFGLLLFVVSHESIAQNYNHVKYTQPARVYINATLSGILKYNGTGGFVTSSRSIKSQKVNIIGHGTTVLNNEWYDYYDFMFPGEKSIYRYSKKFMDRHGANGLSSRVIPQPQPQPQPQAQVQHQAPIQAQTRPQTIPQTSPKVKLRPFRELTPAPQAKVESLEDHASRENLKIEEALEKSAKIMGKCLETELDHKNIEEAYPKKQCDMQSAGTCAGYAGVNAIEAALYRYYRDNLKMPFSSPQPILTEPLYMLAFASYASANLEEFAYRFKPGTPVNHNLLSGVFASTFFEHLIHTIKTHKTLIGESSANREFSRETFLAADVNLKKAIEVAHGRYPQIKNSITLLEKDLENIVDEKGKTHPLWHYMNKSLESSGQKVIEQFADSKLNIDPGFFESLRHDTIFSVNEHVKGKAPCDIQKLKNTFTRYLCGDLPVTISGNFPSILKGQGHSLLLTGYKHKLKKSARPKNSPDADLVFLARNSMGSNEPVEIPLSEICGTAYADTISAGLDGATVPAVERSSVYDFEDVEESLKIPLELNPPRDAVPTEESKPWSFPWNFMNWGH